MEGGNKMTATIEMWDTKFMVEFDILNDFATLVCPEQSDIHIESLKVYDSEIDILPIIERIGGYREKIFDEIKNWL